MTASYAICHSFNNNLYALQPVGLRVTCSLRDPRFAGSNPAEVNGFFQDVKILSTGPPGDFRLLKNQIGEFMSPSH